MYFDSTADILEISKKTGCAVFVLPDIKDINIENALVIEPDDKTVITVEQVRGVIGSVSNRQITDRYIIIRPADKLSEVAANAFLKNLEEPNEKVHYILVTSNFSKLLPTILSRSAIYFLREGWSCEQINANQEEKALAKKLIAAKGKELLAVAEEISAKKRGVREYALRVVAISIEILYKSYFLTGKDIFIKKLAKFIKLYNDLGQNGHIKLHFVADLC